MQNIKISVVVPAYNEEKRIEECIKKLYAYFSRVDYSYEIIISDDGSTDKTKEIVEKFQHGWPQLRILENVHRGKAPTVISGMVNATGEFALMTDVDLSVDIKELSKLLFQIENTQSDVAIASREGIGAKRINEPLMRHIMGRVFNALVQIVILPGINDTQCGFKLFRSDVARKIFDRTRLYSLKDKEITGGRVSAFDVEILYVARLLGFKIVQVPIVWVYAEDSKVHNLKDSYYNAKDVFKVRINSLLGKYKF